MMFIDYTAPAYEKGDIIKIKGKAALFKIKKVIEDESGNILYYVQSTQEYIIDEEQITKTIKLK